ncbi:glycosyltransferase [Candidatus Scalindua japonica]|uniref:Glycosyltransferase n=1 Tax=Candidatus Scalindua japonica TaxID=1284222 RepID=A0A286U3W6_9BACT|nr:PEP-CTERM sorting domain-containing protein [Candidatus Scalindua japonica]GAX62850.1 glycosyltransferase [Candidatus Scalindua japonica]
MNIKTKIFTLLLLGLIWTNASFAGFIQPTSLISNAAGFYNTPSLLISDASGNGGVNYSAPGPSNGGGGTSWWTTADGSSGVVLTFDFSGSQSLDRLYLWDYYFHTPTNWNLSLFSGAGGTGTELMDFNFSVATGAFLTSTKHELDFADVNGALSGTLTTLNNSVQGVGLSELGFTTTTALQDLDITVVPEPSTFVLLGLGFVGIIGFGYRRYMKTLTAASFKS